MESLKIYRDKHKLNTKKDNQSAPLESVSYLKHQVNNKRLICVTDVKSVWDYLLPVNF